MSPYSITDDGDEINIRATITQRWELAELVTKLQQRVDALAVNISTHVEAVNQLAERNKKFGEMLEEGTLPSGSTFSAVVKDGVVQEVTITAAASSHCYDAQDVNRKELKNE